MEANGPTITKELKNDIEVNQIELLYTIRHHQFVFTKLKECPENEKLQQELKADEEQIIQLGVKQKELLTQLREEYQAYQNSLKTSVVSSALEERRQKLAASLNRARKQNLVSRSRKSPPVSPPENEFENLPPEIPSEEQPTMPQDVAQPVFMGYLRLVTHEVFGEMQRKRAERRRRSTANPHFVYGNRGWDFFGPPSKRKRKFLARPPSPPNTRGRKRQELAIMSHVRSVEPKKEQPLPTIPNLPNGLVIERVSPGSTSPDSKQCIVCKQPGALSICGRCTNGFHVSCHNRPFSKMPKECPKCLKTDGRRSASTSSSNSASSSCSLSAYSSPTELTEKVTFKQELEEKRKELTAEVTQLQNRHSELTIAVREQEETQNRLRSNNEQTEAKVQRLIEFIQSVQNGPILETSES